MNLKQRIEKRTGVLWGVGRWSGTDASGPSPLFYLVIRPKNQGWMRFEIGALGRFFYATRDRS